MCVRHNRPVQHGMTLIEVMIAMAVGLLVVGAVLSVYLVTLRTSGETITAGRLNQEVAAIMNVMANDIRRAGYARAEAPAPDWDNNGVSNFQEPSTNPFNQRGSTALEVHDTATDADKGVQGKGDCIVYAYDASNDGVVGEMGSSVDPANPEFPGRESFGFKLVKTTVGGVEYGAVRMRQSINDGIGEVRNSCADGDWDTLSDGKSINITKLEFDLANSRCVNTLEPNQRDDDGANGVDDLGERDCYDAAHNIDTPNYGDGGYRDNYPPPPAPIPVVEIRHVLITLEAALRDDPDVTIKMTQQVTVRNHLARLVVD